MEPQSPLARIRKSRITKSNAKSPQTPETYTARLSLQNINQIAQTRSPNSQAETCAMKTSLQQNILSIIEDNSRMIGFLTDLDFEIQQNEEELFLFRSKIWEHEENNKVYDSNSKESASKTKLFSSLNLKQ